MANYSWGQIIPGDKLFLGTNYSWGQIIPGDKLFLGTNYSWGQNGANPHLEGVSAPLPLFSDRQWRKNGDKICPQGTNRGQTGDKIKIHEKPVV